MRILGWMHRKLRQSSAPDPLKDLQIGRSSLDASKPEFPRAATKHYSDHLKPFHEEEIKSDDLFTHWNYGFLAIGTLGLDPVGPAAPAIDRVESEKITQASKVAHVEINAVQKKERSWDGGSRACHVYPIKTTDTPAEDVIWSSTHSLDPVRMGAGVDIESGSRVAVVKECRSSLDEFFARSKPESEETHEPLERTASEKVEEPKAAHLVKKMLKRCRAGSSKPDSRSSHSVAPENAFHKLFQMFNRKVHPSDICLATTKCPSDNLQEFSKIIVDFDMLYDRDNFIHVDPVTGKEKLCRRKSQAAIKAPKLVTARGSESNGNREHWVKTDADYLVLEL